MREGSKKGRGLLVSTSGGSTLNGSKGLDWGSRESSAAVLVIRTKQKGGPGKAENCCARVSACWGGVDNHGDGRS